MSQSFSIDSKAYWVTGLLGYGHYGLWVGLIIELWVLGRAYQICSGTFWFGLAHQILYLVSAQCIRSVHELLVHTRVILE